MTRGAELTTDAVRSFLHALPSLQDGVDEAERIDRLRLLEELKAAATAAQALEAVALDRSRRAAETAAGMPVATQARGLAGEVGLALRISPHRAQRWLGWAKIVTTELPRTFAELQAGRTTEWRATLVARETIFLSRADRAAVDAALAPELESWGDRRTGDEARRAACRLDPAGAAERAGNAAADRRVTLCPAPDTMCRLTALLPVATGVAAWAALKRDADSAVATGDAADRSHGQVMADLLAERLTGQTSAAAVPIEIELVMTDQTLFGTGPGREEPAVLVGHGTVPAELARDLATDGSAQRWVRRLFTSPTTGHLVALDSNRRFFPAGLQRFLRLRDQTCRTPWCDAPVRHADHVRPHADGGPTSAANGQGLCARCNYLKDAGRRTNRAGPGSTVTTLTPTGHSYDSRPPVLPRAGDRFRHRFRPLDGEIEIVWHRAA